MVYWVRGQMGARLPSGGRQNGPQRKGGGQAERDGKQAECAGPMHSWAPTTETGGLVGEGGARLSPWHFASGTDVVLQAAQYLLQEGVL